MRPIVRSLAVACQGVDANERTEWAATEGAHELRNEVVEELILI